MIKLLACDIDGTLLPAGSRRVEREILELLAQIMRKGVKLAIASGRSLYEIEALFSDLSPSPCMIADDGALAVGDGELFYSRPLDFGDMSMLLRRFRGAGVPALFSTANGRFVLENGAGEALLAQCGVTKSEPRISALSELSVPVYKLSFFCTAPLTVKPTATAGCRIYYQHDGWLEYIPRFADKGLALAALQSRCYADSFDTLVLGDEKNDIGMAKKAKYSVCIGDCCPELAAVCTARADRAAAVLRRLAEDPEGFSLP